MLHAPSKLRELCARAASGRSVVGGNLISVVDCPCNEDSNSGVIVVADVCVLHLQFMVNDVDCVRL